MARKLTYVGIGAQETPNNVLELMTTISHELARADWVLRTGMALGGDTAFYKGASKGAGEIEIFIPWNGFNKSPKNTPQFIIPNMNDKLQDLCRRIHAKWDKLSKGAKALHARNACQILGLELDKPADMVVCWTENGLGQGTTSHTLRLANLWGIPVFDLARQVDQEALCDFVSQHESRQLAA